MRLIDANALISDLRSFEGLGAVVAETLVRFVEKQPTVEVIPCKSCKHSRQTAWYSAKLRCTHPSHMNSQVPYEVPQEHFCGYGERRDNEHT